MAGIHQFPVTTQLILGKKPHIYFANGYWRVSLWNRRQDQLHLWIEANSFAVSLNAKKQADKYAGF